MCLAFFAPFRVFAGPKGRLLLLLAACLLGPWSGRAQTAREKVDALLGAWPEPGVIRSAVGITRAETPISSLLTSDVLDYRSPKTRILLVGGLDGSPISVEATMAAMRWFLTASDAAAYRERFSVGVVPVANPDGWASGTGPANGAGGDPTRGYPPAGDAYSSATDPEAAYLWRWIGMHAPDLAVEVRASQEAAWLIPANGSTALSSLGGRLQPSQALPESDELVSQLVRNSPSGVGSVPALRRDIVSKDEAFLEPLLRALEEMRFGGPSPARQEIHQRLNRTPLQVARELTNYYGHKLDDPAYIPAMAVVGRLRLGEITGDPSHLAAAEALTQPFVTGAKAALPEQPSGSVIAGHPLFGELAKATGNARYLELARQAADVAFDEQGQPREAMPSHNEMSDAVFMSCPILAQVGSLTDDGKYYEMALRHMRFMLRLNLRADGLHRHSPLDEAAWGRGNGFPALGLALSLSEMPGDIPGRAEMLAALRAHLEALLRHQDETGMWRQVIDLPGSYRELTSTAMITVAMARGVRLGWLEESRFRPAIVRAWYALRTRVAANGELVDVCTGTGKQRSLRDYLDRTAILGRDDRGGAMALLVATELARWERERGPLDEAVRAAR
jgi:unsaturated rhamnogalacturonyl hydrolase